MTERLPTLEEGIAERESLREQRAANYAVKNAANWTCQHEGCERNVGVVVVSTNKGPQARCIQHIGGHRVMPGQWYERSAI